MSKLQDLDVTDCRPSTGDHFFDKFSEQLIEERNERRRTYINIILVVACVMLIAFKFVV